jgi:hypothetical protein
VNIFIWDDRLWDVLLPVLQVGKTLYKSAKRSQAERLHHGSAKKTDEQRTENHHHHHHRTHRNRSREIRAFFSGIIQAASSHHQGR